MTPESQERSVKPAVSTNARKRSWVEYLCDQMDEEWRPSEWRPDLWFFSGDPDNPATRIFRCSTPNCIYLTDVRNSGRCMSCRRIFQLVDGDEAEFQQRVNLRTTGTRPRDGTPKPLCRVVRNGKQCQRARFTRGVCETHNNHWRLTYAARGMTLDEFVDSAFGNALVPIGACLVGGCDRERQNAKTRLCPPHRARYRQANQSTQLPPTTEKEFAASSAAIAGRGEFSLIDLPEPLRSELVVALQEEDRSGYSINPVMIRALIPEFSKFGPSFADPKFRENALAAEKKKLTSRSAFLGRASTAIERLRDRFDDVDPTAGDVWDSYIVGLRTNNHLSGRALPRNEGKYLSRRSLIDFQPIRQTWLRELVKQWARDMLPTTLETTQTITAFAILSEAICQRAGADDPGKAGVRDIQKALELINKRRRPDGEPYSSGTRSNLLTRLRRTLYYLRGANLMDSVPLGFTVTPDHRVARMRPSDDAPGKALPYRVVAAISAALPSYAVDNSQTGSLIDAKILTELHRTALRVMIDTGRRPNEICTLKVGCVSSSPTDGPSNDIDFTLTYTNHKSAREGRTIPITKSTAEVILKWEKYRLTLALPRRYDQWLFPSPSAGRADADRCLTTGGLERALSALVRLVPRLEDDVPDRESGGYLLFKGKIEPYSFRHSYFQRHADAGVDLETLQELGDHQSPQTTLAYFKVSAKRKREAIEKLSKLSVDSHGRSAPMGSSVAYEIGSVAVPWGNCKEPSNVKAGGHACPIRFRCAGCSFYRPDASFLPAIEEHVVQLRATFSMVQIAGTVAPWVLQEMREEINGYEQIMNSIRDQISSLPIDEQTAVEDASIAMRRLRAQRPLIPLTVRRSGDAS